MTACACAFRILAFLVAFAGIARPQERTVDATIVVFNTNDPESESLARFYAKKRGIDSAKLVGLPCSLAEEITRAEFRSTIAEPLRQKLVRSGWWKMTRGRNGRQIVASSSVRFVALMRGIPLKIAPDADIPPVKDSEGLPAAIATRNDASVDSEISALGLPDFSEAGIVPNPYFGRFTQILDDTGFPGLLLTGRLDAPSAMIVRAMIDDALLAEREGLWGWGCVDGRNITSGGYSEGDHWMKRLVGLLRERGVPTIFDNLPETFAADFPLTDVAVYYGWYAGDLNGPFADPAFFFKPGAVAVHIHSFSASTLRSTTAHWCAPLLVKGAAATLGNVYEPYLSLTANLDIFQDRLMTGLTLAESGAMSQRGLSWMGVVIGDPLYRPYAAWNSFYDPRSNPPNPWRRYRSIVLSARGDLLSAILPLHEAAKETRQSFFLEALGAAQADAGHASAAEGSFRDALGLNPPPAVQARLQKEIAALSAGSPPKPVESQPPMPDAPLPGATPPVFPAAPSKAADF